MARPKTTSTAQNDVPVVKPPGEILLQEFMRPLGLSAYRVSKELGVAPITISEILRGLRSITPFMACRLGAFFETHPVYWLTLQATYDVHHNHSNGASDGVAPYRHLNGRKLGPTQAHKSISLWQECWALEAEPQQTPAQTQIEAASPRHQNTENAAGQASGRGRVKKTPKILDSGQKCSKFRSRNERSGNLSIKSPQKAQI